MVVISVVVADKMLSRQRLRTSSAQPVFQNPLDGVLALAAKELVDIIRTAARRGKQTKMVVIARAANRVGNVLPAKVWCRMPPPATLSWHVRHVVLRDAFARLVKIICPPVNGAPASHIGTAVDTVLRARVLGAVLALVHAARRRKIRNVLHTRTRRINAAHLRRRYFVFVALVHLSDDFVSVRTSLASTTWVYCVEEFTKTVYSVVRVFHLLLAIAAVVVLVVPVLVAETQNTSRPYVFPAPVANCASTRLRSPGKLSFLAKKQSMLYENARRSM